MFEKLCLLFLVTSFTNLWISYADSTQEKIKPSSSQSFIELYEQGVDNYLSNEYEDCVYFLENAIDGYRKYYETTAICRIECEYVARDYKHRGDFLHPNDIENLHFYEVILKRTLCLVKCRLKNRSVLPFEKDFDGYYMDLFKRRQPYSYLHACYTNTKQLNEAASAALTYMVKNPDDRIMQRSFEILIENQKVNKEEIQDLEEKKFVKQFVEGVLAINDKNWSEAISFIERSILQYVSEENQCRAYCEGEFDHGFLPDFISAIGNHFTNSLYCKRNCTMEMEMVRGKYYENLFARHYQYLQIAYYEVNQYQESYNAGLSYLLFLEDDVEMLDKLGKIVKEVENFFENHQLRARTEATKHHDRNVYEKSLITFIKEEFKDIKNIDVVTNPTYNDVIQQDTNEIQYQIKLNNDEVDTHHQTSGNKLNEL